MPNVINKGIEQITKRSTNSLESRIADKLKGGSKVNNVETISFPLDLDNIAQCTYMTIYIFDSKQNQQKFENAWFNSALTGDEYEIPIINKIKAEVQDSVIDPLKKKLESTKESVVQSAKSWLNRQKEALNFESNKDDQTNEISSISAEIKTATDWINKNLVPKRKKSELKDFQDLLDPVKNPDGGYQLVKAIQIQMPNSAIKYSYENGWDTQDAKTYNMMRTLVDGIQKVFDSDTRDQGKSELKAVGGQVIRALGDAVTGGGYSAAAQAEHNYVVNPVMVFNYSIPSPRTFTYQFSLYPRSKDELYALYNLIQTLKFYSLPEISGYTSKGKGRQQVTINYPAKFAIKFYTNGYENRWFHKTISLGLTHLEETLTGESGDMAYFENYFDTKTGNPPRMINLSLTFKELGILSRNHVAVGY